MGGRLKLEFEFPEPIIQHIQSLLTGEEAARTTLLSKSWYGAWLTRPNLDFDDSRFNERIDVRFSGTGEFSQYAKKTIKRYEQSNLKIDSLKLCMKRNNPCCGAALAKKLVLKALGLGATILSIRLDTTFVVPCEVVFGADNLVHLSLEGCKINPHGLVIKCFRIESLCLDGVQTTRETLSKIISSCPLIEKLSLSNFMNIHNNHSGGLASFWQNNETQYHEGGLFGPVPPYFPPNNEAQAWDIDNIYDDYYEDGWEWDGPRSAAIATGPIMDNLVRLRCLGLCYDSFENLFPGNSLSKFPFLMDFTLKLKKSFLYSREEEVQISNSSLEHIKIELEEQRNGNVYDDPHMRRLKVKLDVPSIRKFTFECGYVIPLVSVISTSTREWESHVSLKRVGGLPAFWWNQLNELFVGLSRSKIHLSLLVNSIPSFDYNVGDANNFRKHELENLTLDMTDLPSLSCRALFDGLFRLCRPKMITQGNLLKDTDGNQNPYFRSTRKKNIDFLCEVLVEGMHEKVWFPRQLMYGLNDLEEVSAQVYDVVGDVPEWRPIPLSSLLNENRNIPIQQYPQFDPQFGGAPVPYHNNVPIQLHPYHNNVPIQLHRFLLKWKP